MNKQVKRSKIRSGTVTHLIVVHKTGRIILGSGWIFTCEHGSQDRPILIDNNGNQMEYGWYQIEVTSEVLAISSDRIH